MKVEFETAVIRDAVKKAAAVSPSNGLAFDKAAGIKVTCSPDGTAEIRATDTFTYFITWVTLTKPPTERTEWLFDSNSLSAFLDGLAVGTGQHVTFEEQRIGSNTRVVGKSNRTKMTFFLLTNDAYPTWSAFDPGALNSSIDFGGRLAMVEWATEPKTSGTVLAGVLIDGDQMVATDRYIMCSSTFKIELAPDQKIVVPPGVLTQILKQTGEIKFGFDGNGQMLLMPDEWTQIRVLLYEAEYPNVARATVRNQTHSIKVRKEVLLGMMTRAIKIAGGARNHRVTMFIGSDKLAITSKIPDKAEWGDAFDLSIESAQHPFSAWIFDPTQWQKALSYCPNEELEIHYTPDSPQKTLWIDGGSGYEVWIKPFRDIEPPKSEDES